MDPILKSIILDIIYGAISDSLIYICFYAKQYNDKAYKKDVEKEWGKVNENESENCQFRLIAIGWWYPVSDEETDRMRENERERENGVLNIFQLSENKTDTCKYIAMSGSCGFYESNIFNIPRNTNLKHCKINQSTRLRILIKRVLSLL